MQRDRLPYLLIPLAACIAILPLLVQGCSCGHDFDFHILSWLEAARQFTHGNLHPHWAYTPAYNAGEPRFVFYPPLSWTLGAILTLFFPIAATPILYTWIALTASGLALHRLARDFAPPTAALLAAIFYTVNPYMLFTAYERTAYAELLAAAFIPLLLHAILRPRATISGIAIPVALLWLTNAPAAVMSCYALALLAIIRVISATLPDDRKTATAPANPNNPSSQSRLHLAANTLAGIALGLALAAFYILPAAYERRYVQIAMAVIPNMRVQDNFLFHHTGDIPHDQVLHTASLIAILLIVATVIALATTLYTTQKARGPQPSRSSEGWDLGSSPSRSLLFPLAILTAAIILLLTPLTAIIWSHAPELAFLQFPWRLLAVLTAALGLAAALALHPLQLKPFLRAAIAVAIAAAFTYPAYSLFHQSCDPEDTPQAREALFHATQGTDPTDEYTPITADNDSLAQRDPAFWLSPDPNAKAPVGLPPTPAPTHLSITAGTPEDLILNLRDYPSWRITDNGSLVTARDQRDDGLIAVPVPAGPSTIDITYAQTLDQTLGDAISLVSLALLLFLFTHVGHHQPPRSVSPSKLLPRT